MCEVEKLRLRVWHKQFMQSEELVTHPPTQRLVVVAWLEEVGWVGTEAKPGPWELPGGSGCNR